MSALLIAEIGLNHNGEYGLAERSIRAAAAAGADAVKFQNFKTEDFLADREMTYTYRSQGRTLTEPFFDLCKRNEFRDEWLPDLKRLCDELSVVFLSTPTSSEGVRLLAEAGCRYVKNGSDYLTHVPLLREMARSGMTVIVSTGMAEQADIDAAVQAVTGIPGAEAILLHCTSLYPTPPEETNLRRMIALRERYRLPIGFSDHTEGWEAAVQAVSLGAVVVEKHFTLDRDLPGPDHWFSSTPAEFGELVAAVRRAERRLGSEALAPSPGEAAYGGAHRIGVLASRPLPAGAALTEADVVFKKPASGILPREIERYFGRRLTCAVDADQPLKPEHFEAIS